MKFYYIIINDKNQRKMEPNIGDGVFLKFQMIEPLMLIKKGL